MNLTKVQKLAGILHREQLRKDNVTPYITHPIEVMTMLRDELKCDDPIMLAAALLHDVLEDCDINGTVLFLQLIEECEASHVQAAQTMSLVEQVTNTDNKYGFHSIYNRKIRKGIENQKFAYSSWQAAAIKSCDRICNIRTIDDMDDDDFKRLYFRESIALLDTLLRNLGPLIGERPVARKAFGVVIRQIIEIEKWNKENGNVQN